ncbi:MAG: DUF484 family protein [Pseudomonadota bacterium]|nr:DUF484 family protein [Pseudomonadota bacterium]
MARQDEDKADTIPDEATVAAYLAENPDFLVRHPELVQLLDAPSRFAAQADGANVVDMQTFMVGRLQADLARARRDQVELIQSARSNLTSQGQIHEAVLAALDARDFEHFIHIVTSDFPLMLDVDAVTLCVEDREGHGASGTAGVYALEPETVNALIGGERRILLRPETRGDERLFGPAASLVRSDALVRLSLGRNAPHALMTLGSRERGRFHPGQGTELLGFLAGTLERQLRRWLDLPPG